MYLKWLSDAPKLYDIPLSALNTYDGLEHLPVGAFHYYHGGHGSPLGRIRRLALTLRLALCGLLAIIINIILLPLFK